MNTTHKKILIVLIILAMMGALVVITSRIFIKEFIQQPSIQNQQSTSVTPATSSTPSVPATSTTGTKTYRNEEWGFEFQYPADWAIEENYFKNYYSKFNLRIIPTNERHSKVPIGINIVLPEFIDHSFGNIEKTISEIIVDGITGTKYEYEFGGRQETAIILPFEEYRLILWTDDESYVEIFNQVVSSFNFKFLE
ncbi:MAG: hypothetical protein ABIJ28_03075 [Patescibacteria group bacterium]